jgi:hypothetical protein
MVSLSGAQKVVSRPFSGERVEGVPLFSAREKENVIFIIYEHSWA